MVSHCASNEGYETRVAEQRRPASLPPCPFPIHFVCRDVDGRCAQNIFIPTFEGNHGHEAGA